MQHFKENTVDTSDTVPNVCRDYKSVNTYGEFGEIEKLNQKAFSYCT
jgi:hypothetical protein